MGKAMIREATNDIRGTLHQVYFGQPEHQSEMGTPMHPTPGNIDRGFSQEQVPQKSQEPQQGGFEMEQ
ncbi:MAG: hypothetical protein K8U57_21525 [Planctomycetes bacterium]|nr:hypothetical protein [Planctomycetota bacterium]